MACHVNGLPCINGVRKDFPEDPQTGQKLTCRQWTHVLGANPQPPGDPIDHFDCSFAWMPILQIETSKQVHQSVAGLDKVANEISGLKNGIPIKINVPFLPQDTAPVAVLDHVQDTAPVAVPPAEPETAPVAVQPQASETAPVAVLPKEGADGD